MQVTSFPRTGCQVTRQEDSREAGFHAPHHLRELEGPQDAGPADQFSFCIGATSSSRDGRKLTHSFLVAQEGLVSVFFQGIFKSDLVQEDVPFQRC